jgi:tetratricopeptide (TPR) repeat protein
LEAASLAAQLEVLPKEAARDRCIGLLAVLSAELDDASMAQQLYGLLEPYAGLFIASGVVVFGAVDLHLGILATVLGRFDDAEAHFATADRIHEDAGTPAWLARTRLEWGRMLQKRGDPDRARPLLEQALATAARIGQGSVERRARQALQDEADA